MEVYQPIRRFSTKYFMLSILIGVGGIFIVAIGAFLLSNIIHFVFLYPFIIAFLIMILSSSMIQKGRILNRRLAFILTLAMGVCVYVLYHYADYIYVRTIAINNWVQKYEITRAEGRVGFNLNLIDLTGTGGFLGFLKYMASEGISFRFWLSIGGTAATPTGPLSIVGIGVWIYWLVELAVILTLLVLFTKGTGQVFSTEYQDWYGNFTQIATVHGKNMENFLSLIKKGDYSPASKMIDLTNEDQHPQFELSLCKNPFDGKGKRVLRIKETRIDKNLQIKRRIFADFEPEFVELKKLKLVRD